MLFHNVNLTSKQYAAVMGLDKDLRLKGDDFTNAATAFFIAYLVAEVPNGIPLHPLSPSLVFHSEHIV